MKTWHPSDRLRRIALAVNIIATAWTVRCAVLATRDLRRLDRVIAVLKAQVCEPTDGSP